ncbi:FAD-dependent oxidoreductase [Dolichospermum sp. UHCC 0684]|jgi:lysine 2-monooxygenase|uniref:flavin monoamine oxidase family protein n=1 Tax=unclassified Dolichospermum TaxID=2622029 RepID=UPI00144730A7|nr:MULTISPECIES: FAD-dependent oxidoreductase [unclassified Dolichospermum]MEA5529079.1 FAD-dependent oxidoreductase [Dolichospermum sp. UHCC 0684]MTJ35849.1 FAD-dependent oxidoreductase [Dolichospermum sp. UHCC 0260]
MIVQSNTIDVAIIGGGISGIYSAWRLANEKNDLKISLFESSERLGGRLYSVAIPGIPERISELGAMRYRSNQLIINNLIEKMNLTSVKFESSSGENLLYLRGKHFKHQDFYSSSEIPYNLHQDELGKNPTELLATAIEKFVPDAKKMSSEQWNQLKKSLLIDGESIHNIGIWNLLFRSLSVEAYNLLVDAGGYCASLTNWNAAEALQWFMITYGEKTEYRTILEGFQSLTLRLAEQFIDRGGVVQKNQQLETFNCLDYNEDNNKLIKLIFTDQINGTTNVLYTKHLILAIPQYPLKVLSEKTDFFEEDIKQDIDSVIAQPAYKLFLGYERPWWKDLGLEYGRSDTDLPIREVFYATVKANSPKIEHQNNLNSFILASYHRGFNQAMSFWQPLIEGKPYLGTKNPFSNSTGLDGLWATKNMVLAVQDQLKELHQIEHIPQPYIAVFKDWSAKPFGGGFHFWKTHIKPWEVAKRLRRPKQNENVYLCGEAYAASEQTWVEGALKTTELMLQENFKLEKPEWLSQSYKLD